MIMNCVDLRKNEIKSYIRKNSHGFYVQKFYNQFNFITKFIDAIGKKQNNITNKKGKL